MAGFRVTSRGIVEGSPGVSLGVSARPSGPQRIFSSSAVPAFPVPRDDLTLNLDDYWSNALYDNSPSAGMAAAIGTLTAAGGGTLVASAKNYTGLDGNVTFPVYVNFRGQGKSKNPAGGATRLSAPSGGPWTISFQSRGGLSGHMTLDGGITPVIGSDTQVNAAVQRTFIDLETQNATGDALVVNQSQNCTFIGCDVFNPTGYCFVLKNGASGNSFLRCEGDTGQTGAVHVFQGSGSYLAQLPAYNVFRDCIFERMPAGATAGIYSQGGLTFFDTCQVATVSAIPHVLMANFDGFSTTNQIWMHRCKSTGSTVGTIGLKTDSTFAHTLLLGQHTWQGLNTAYLMADGTFVTPFNNIVYNSVTTRFATNGGVKTEDGLIRGAFAHPMDWSRPAAGNNALTTKLAADAGYRTVLTGDGILYLGDGSTFTFSGYPHFVGSSVATAIMFLNGASLDISSAGKGLRVSEGANGKQGVATLAAGTVTVANTNITSSSRVFLTAQDNNTTGALRVSARTAGTSFTITSSNAADTGAVAFEIFEPG